VISESEIVTFSNGNNPAPTNTKPCDAKPHWTYVTPEYLSKAFAEARDATELFHEWAPETKPTFHEIRPLGARIYRYLDYPKDYIQTLMSHTDIKTTEIYLSNPSTLRPEHFHKANANMEIFKLKGLEI
jgi:integrase